MSSPSQGKDNKIIKRLKETFDVGAEGAVSTIATFMGESLLGQVLPGVTSVYFSYKQKRMEENMERLITEVKKHEDELNQRLSRLESGSIIKFRDTYLGIISDYVIDEVQEDKIEFIVNGLVNLAGYEIIQDDFVLTYYDTLRDLRIIDIAILKMYYCSYNALPTKNFQEILNEFGMDYSQYDAVREKLSRMGLLRTRREKEMDDLYKNVIEIQGFIEELNKGKTKKLSRLNRLSKNDSYDISVFGRNFIEFFIDLKEEAI